MSARKFAFNSVSVVCQLISSVCRRRASDPKNMSVVSVVINPGLLWDGGLGQGGGWDGSMADESLTSAWKEEKKNV